MIIQTFIAHGHTWKAKAQDPLHAETNARINANTQAAAPRFANALPLPWPTSGPGTITLQVKKGPRR